MQEPAAVDISLTNRNGTALNGAARSPSPNRSSAGFTAVNSAHKRTALFRPIETEPTGPTSKSPPKAFSGTTLNGHGWRPSDSGANGGSADAALVIGKRKRSDQPPGDETAQLPANGAVSDGSPVPPPTTVDSAVDPTPSDHFNPLRAPSATDSDPSEVEHPSYAREKSPVERWNKGHPPPKPRPETERSLAASLQQFQQQSQQVREAQHNPPYSPRYGSPTEEGEPVGESQLPSDDQYGDWIDPKRRKRNFSNRTKTGCHTCRKRKKKCDEAKPTCQNCERGNFQCEGYGPKPPGLKMASQTRTVMPLQSKTPMAPYNGRHTESPSARVEDGRSYSHWGRVPPVPPPPASVPLPPPPPSESELPRPFAPATPADHRRQNSAADTWSKASYASPHDAPPPPHVAERLPPSFPPMPPLHPPYPHDHRQHPPPPIHSYPPSSYTPQPPPPSRHQSHGPSMSLDPWSQHMNVGPYSHSHPPGPSVPALPVGSSRGSATTSISHRSDPFQLGYPMNHSQVEKDKMLRGQPFLHELDPLLCQERESCEGAVYRYNNAAYAERGKLFSQILNPYKRPDAKSRERPHGTPDGSIGDHSIVKAPFHCEYGYNIHIGNKCVIGRGCTFQDAADVFVGNGVKMGTNVTLECMTTPIDPSARNQGSQDKLIAGAIKIEDECFIGTNSTILPFVTIGRGAVVGAGSVVTKDVEEYTVVAGVPARLIRRIEGSNVGRPHSQQVQRQQEKMVNWMVRNANTGFPGHHGTQR